MDSCVYSNYIKISPKTLMCVSLPKTKKRRMKTRMCLLQTFQNVSQGSLCVFLCPISEVREEQAYVSYMY